MNRHVPLTVNVKKQFVGNVHIHSRSVFL